MHDFLIAGVPWALFSEVSARSCTKQSSLNSFKQWCEALSSFFSSSGGPPGSNSRFVTNLCPRQLNLKINSHIHRHVETRLFCILVGATGFTGVVLNIKVEGGSPRINVK